MTPLKIALVGSAMIALSAAAARADELQDVKAQIEALDARMAVMDAATSVSADYQLLTISRGRSARVPGFDEPSRDRFTIGRGATVISVLPAAEAPAGTVISWSGYARAAIRYDGESHSETSTRTLSDDAGGQSKVTTTYEPADVNDWDVVSRGQLRVIATTDTAVGKVGVELKMRGDFKGDGPATFYISKAWGYWAMTPELALGGGYASSLGKVDYGYDGSCVCYYTDNADVDFNPGDTTQLRLTYARGPFTAAVAVEDSGFNDGFGNDNEYTNGDRLGVAGRITYAGDAFSGEIAGLYRSTNNEDYPDPSNFDGLWQIGTGGEYRFGEMANLSIGAALGEGPYQTVDDNGDITNSLPVFNRWWGVSGLASANVSDTVHAEVAAGYKHREGDDFEVPGWSYDGFGYDTWAFLGGVYYNPVDQLTIGAEAEWSTQSWNIDRSGLAGGANNGIADELDVDQDKWTVDIVTVWRF